MIPLSWADKRSCSYLSTAARLNGSISPNETSNRETLYRNVSKTGSKVELENSYPARVVNVVRKALK